MNRGEQAVKDGFGLYGIMYSVSEDEENHVKLDQTVATSLPPSLLTMISSLLLLIRYGPMVFLLPKAQDDQEPLQGSLSVPRLSLYLKQHQAKANSID